VEQLEQSWIETWLAQSKRLETYLGQRRSLWAEEAERWLYHQFNTNQPGVVVYGQALSAAVTEWLLTFTAGVNNRRVEAEEDMQQLYNKIGKAAERVQTELAGLPATLPEAVLGWALRPGRWWPQVAALSGRSDLLAAPGRAQPGTFTGLATGQLL
jgi:hypothetical protein